jgi:hypothetical protein
VVFIAAWIGFGADGLYSSCYGPEQAFLALGEQLGLYLAAAVALIIIALS